MFNNKYITCQYLFVSLINDYRLQTARISLNSAQKEVNFFLPGSKYKTGLYLGKYWTFQLQTCMIDITMYMKYRANFKYEV